MYAVKLKHNNGTEQLLPGKFNDINTVRLIASMTVCTVVTMISYENFTMVKDNDYECILIGNITGYKFELQIIEVGA